MTEDVSNDDTPAIVSITKNGYTKSYTLPDEIAQALETMCEATGEPINDRVEPEVQKRLPDPSTVRSCPVDGIAALRYWHLINTALEQIKRRPLRDGMAVRHINNCLCVGIVYEMDNPPGTAVIHQIYPETDEYAVEADEFEPVPRLTTYKDKTYFHGKVVVPGKSVLFSVKDFKFLVRGFDADGSPCIDDRLEGVPWYTIADHQYTDELTSEQLEGCKGVSP